MAIATLVERSTRFVILVALPGGKLSEHVAARLTDAMAWLPQRLRASLSWNQGTEWSPISSSPSPPPARSTSATRAHRGSEARTRTSTVRYASTSRKAGLTSPPSTRPASTTSPTVVDHRWVQVFSAAHLEFDPHVHRSASGAVPPVGAPGRPTWRRHHRRRSPGTTVGTHPAGPGRDGCGCTGVSNLTMRQIGLSSGVALRCPSGHRHTLEPLLALAPARRRPTGEIAIVDGTLIPTPDHRLAAQSKNYRYSANLQVAIDANTRLFIALGGPHPGKPQRHHRVPHQRHQSTAGRPRWGGDAVWGRRIMPGGAPGAIGR
jgi:hypothetical protein